MLTIAQQLGDTRSGPKTYDFARPALAEVISPVQVTGRLLIGHTADPDDPDEPVYVRDILAPGAARTVVLTCPSCPAQTTIGSFGADTLALVQHSPWCPTLAELRELV